MAATRNRFALAVAAFGAAALSLVAPAKAADDAFYQGKTITLYVGRGPGSGADLAVRTFVRFWREHIPGRPTMVVKNMPGGGGNRIWNYGWERAEPDGLHVLFSPLSGTSAILEQKGLRADFSRMLLIGALMNPNLTYVRADKVKNAADLLSVPGLKFAGQSPSHRFDIIGRLGLDMLGVEYSYITGFRGANEVFNALRRGEVDIQFAPLSLYRNSIGPAFIDVGQGIALWHNPTADGDGNLVPLAAIQDIPSFVDYFKSLKGEAPAGEKFEVYKWLVSNVNRLAYAAFLPPGTAEAPLRILRESYAKVPEDQGYRTEEQKMFGFKLPVIDADTGTRIIEDLANAPEYVRIFLRSYVEAGR